MLRHKTRGSNSDVDSGESDADSDADVHCPAFCRALDVAAGGWSSVVLSDASTFSLQVNNMTCSCAIMPCDHHSSPASAWLLRLRVPMLLGSSLQSRLRGQVQP
jgi:hypothetical protein